jgi:hypothetical protein
LFYLAHPDRHDEASLIIKLWRKYMSFNIGNSINRLALVAILSSTSFFAFADNQKIMCPPVEFIQKNTILLNTVSIMDTNKFAVWSTDIFKYINESWHVITYTTAQDLNTALVIGRNNLIKVMEQKDKYATDMKDVYLCGYFSSSNQLGVAAISFKDENTTFKFAVFDFKSFDLKTN